MIFIDHPADVVKKIKNVTRTLLCGMINLAALPTLAAPAQQAAGDEYYFPAEALGGKKVDLSHFSKPGQGKPGEYQVDILVNGTNVDRQLLSFVTNAQGKLVPQLSVQQYKDLGLKIDELPAMEKLPLDQVITNIAQYAPVMTDLDVSKLQLKITVPQKLLNIRPKDYIDPALWNTGMPTAFSNYDLSGSRTLYNQSRQNNEQQQFVNLRNGANIAGLRLRNNSTWQHNNSGINKFTVMQNWLEKDIFPLRSLALIGDISTSSDVLGGFNFRGIALRSQDSMLPSSEQGYRPVIHGIAMTSNARVSVYNNNALIYETYVPAGEFSLTDFNMTSGRMDITVTESDGRVQSFSRFFDNLSIMQREKSLKYDLALGQYRNPGSVSSGTPYNPRFIQASALYGLSDGMTLYGGITTSSDYHVAMIGAAQTLSSFGVLSIDLSNSAVSLVTGDNTNKNGQSLRLRYGKNFTDSGTQISLTGERLNDYYSFTDSINMHLTPSPNDPWGWLLQKQRTSRIDLNIQQSMQTLGSVTLTSSQQNYQDGSRQQSAGAAWNLNISSVSLGLSYTYNNTIYSEDRKSRDQIYSLTASMPFSYLSSKNSMTTSYSLTNNQDGDTREQVGLNGTLLAKNNLSYSVQQSYSSVRSEEYGGNFSVNYLGRAGAAGSAWSYGKQSRKLSYTARGAVVAHPYGISLSQNLSEGSGYALVRAPGTSGIAVMNTTGVATDWWGHAIVPSVQAYRKNNISLDPSTYQDVVDVTMSSIQVIPAKEALVLADYQTLTGNRAMITLIQRDGSVVPFGATASIVDDGSHAGIVGDKGVVYLANLSPQGAIRASWGTESKESCQSSYSLTDSQIIHGISLLTLKCQ